MFLAYLSFFIIKPIIERVFEMRMLTKILSLFLSAVPMTVMAMEIDDITSTSGIKKRSRSLIIAENKEGESNSEAHKRQRAQEYGVAEGEETQETELHEQQKTQVQKVIDTLDQIVPGEKYKEVYKGSEKYKKNDAFKKQLDNLKKLDAVYKELILGENADERLKELEGIHQQLVERYHHNFFANNVIPNEIILNILSYCSTQDLASLIMVSSSVRNAVYSLVPLFQTDFQRIIYYGKYKNISEFFYNFHKGDARAYAAIGIASYMNQQYKKNLLSKNHSQTNTIEGKRTDINGSKIPTKINKWLDQAFKARDALAVTFVLNNDINFSYGLNYRINLLNMIEEVCEKQREKRELLLDNAILNFLEKTIEPKNIFMKNEEAQAIIKILQKYFLHMIRGNLLLIDVFLKFKSMAEEGKGIVVPSLDSWRNYIKNTDAITNSLPDFKKGKAHCEIGLWFLVNHSKNTTYDENSLKSQKWPKTITQHWTQAVDAWTQAAEGDRQKAVANFKEFILDSSLFTLEVSSRVSNQTTSTASLFFLATTKKAFAVRSDYMDIFFQFLSTLYKKDKRSNGQLYPYDKDVNMLLAAARKVRSMALFSSKNMLLNSDIVHNELKKAAHYFKQAIQESLNTQNDEVKEKVTNKLNSIPHMGRFNNQEIFTSYEAIASQLGLSPAK